MTRTLRQTTVISREKIELLVMSDEVISIGFIALNFRVNIRIKWYNCQIIEFLYKVHGFFEKKKPTQILLFFFSYLGFY